MGGSSLETLWPILALAVLTLLITHRLALPPIVGFICTGILAGPSVLGWVSNPTDIATIADIGIVLLMFGIGMEFSLKTLVQVRHLFLLGGALQVGLTLCLTLLIALFSGFSLQEALFAGLLLAMSSTAIVLGILERKGEIASPHGGFTVSVLIFQDMLAIPMIILMPLLAKQGEGEPFDFSLLWLLFKGIVTLGVVFVSAQHFVPRLLHLVARTRHKELFLLSVLSLCFGVALLSSHLGLSLTVGAFLAGLIISESEFSHEAITNIFPFQALFVSLFFISVGLLVNPLFLLQHLAAIAGLALLTIAIKAASAGAAALLMGMPIRTAVLAGIALAQIGEFSFVLARMGTEEGLGDEQTYQLFLAVSLMTMSLSPILIDWSPRLAAALARLPLSEKIRSGWKRSQHEEASPLKDHVIIIGFGVSGQHLARSSKIAQIPYAILEMNADTVHEFKTKGEPIQFGDATQLSILQHLRIQDAKALAVLINDTLAAKQVIALARKANARLYIIVRARYVQEIPMFLHLGADEVIPDEFGTSVEVFSRVLRQYHVPDQEIYAFINAVRDDGYQLLRHQNPVLSNLSDLKLNLSHMNVGSFRLSPHSDLVGKTLLESNLRKRYGISVLLIKRKEEIISNPPPDTVLEEGDVVVVIAEQKRWGEVDSLFGTMQAVTILA